MRKILWSSAAVGVAATLPVLLPLLADLDYTHGDAYGCDLGSLGADIEGFFLGALLLLATVIAAATALRRARVLLVLPVAAVTALTVPRWHALPWPIDSCADEPTSVLGLLLVAVLCGALTYALAQPRAVVQGE